MVKIACIGSRSLAREQEEICEKLGAWIVSCSHELHTGGAASADQSFARGGSSVDPTKVFIHLPWLSYERDALVLGNHVDILASMSMKEQQAYKEYAKVHHPAWSRLSNGGQLLQARNGRILFPNGYPGKPVDLVLAWPSKKNFGGGTSQGIRMSRSEGIEVVDLNDKSNSDLQFLCEKIRELMSLIPADKK